MEGGTEAGSAGRGEPWEGPPGVPGGVCSTQSGAQDFRDGAQRRARGEAVIEPEGINRAGRRPPTFTTRSATSEKFEATPASNRKIRKKAQVRLFRSAVETSVAIRRFPWQNPKWRLFSTAIEKAVEEMARIR